MRGYKITSVHGDIYFAPENKACFKYDPERAYFVAFVDGLPDGFDGLPRGIVVQDITATENIASCVSDFHRKMGAA